MDWSLLGAFFLSAIFLAMAPGPDNLFILSQAAQYGAKRTYWVILGLATGLLCQTLLVALGLSAIVLTSPVLFNGIKLIGALYLLYLAYGAIREGLHSRASSSSVQTRSNGKLALSKMALWRRGLIMNITNPKVQLFFLAFFPQFLPKGLTNELYLVTMLLQGVLFICATILVFGTIANIAEKLVKTMDSPRFRAGLAFASALLFIILAFSTLFL